MLPSPKPCHHLFLLIPMGTLVMGCIQPALQGRAPQVDPERGSISGPTVGDHIQSWFDRQGPVGAITSLNEDVR